MKEQVLCTRVWFHDDRMQSDPWQSQCPDDVEPRSSENPVLYNYEERQESDHGEEENEAWLIICHEDPELVWFGLDLDVGDDHASTIPFSISADLHITADDIYTVKTQSGGLHAHVFIKAEHFPEHIRSNCQGVDLLGEKVNQGAIAPWNNDNYEILNDDIGVYGSEIENGVLQNTIYAEGYSDLYATGEIDRSDLRQVDIPEEPPDDLPQILHKLGSIRNSDDPELGDDRHTANSYIGCIMHHLNYSDEEIHSFFTEYPDGQDGYDRAVTNRALDHIERNVNTGNFNVPHPSTIEQKLQIEVDYDAYPFYNTDIEIDHLVPSIESDNPYADATPHTHKTVTSSARAGKSTLQTKAAAEIVKNNDDVKVLQAVGTHTDGHEQLEKWHREGVRPVYLCGRRYAQQLGCPTGDQNFTSADVRTPEDCKDHQNLNTVTALEQRANDDDIQVVITVMQKIDAVQIDDFDMFISSEEDALEPLKAKGHNLFKALQVNGTDRTITSHILNVRSDIQDFIDQMDSRENLDREWRQLYTAARALDDCCEEIMKWRSEKAGDWAGVDENFQSLLNRLEIRLHQMAFEEPPDDAALWTRVQNQSCLNEVGEMLLHTVFFDGFYDIDAGQQKQIFMISDTERLYGPDLSHMTFWLSGNNLTDLQEFHRLAHGNVPDPVRYVGTHDGITQMRAIWYTGRDNPNQQSHDVQKTIEQIQNTRPTSNLVIAGSSDHTARLAQTIPRSWRPTAQDSVEDLRAMANPGSTTITPENSRHSEGIDTGFFEMGALYNGKFAMPVAEYKAEKRGDEKYVTAEWIRAAQNAALRPANTRSDNTGITPVIIPSMHVPDEMKVMLEKYGIEVVEAGSVEDMRTMIIEYLKMDMEGITVDERARIVRRSETDINAFDMLRRQQTSSSTSPR